MTVRTVEQRGLIKLCCYPRNGWAVLIYKPDKECDWQCVINGKFDDVIKKYLAMIAETS